jgi:signal transduction histidine kinase/CheY-like chemotaxis protein
MEVDTTGISLVVLVLAPVGQDAELAVTVLRTAGIIAEPCESVSELYERLRANGNSVGALVLTEESLVSSNECSNLTNWLEHQEPWSELPIVLLAHPGQRTKVTRQRIRVLSHRGAVTVLERPVRPTALGGSLRVALQSRERQYQLRDLLELQRRAGIELQEARLEAETADRAKDQFLATLSHELRTPLNAISGWTYLMRNAPNDQSLMVQGFDVLQRNTNSLIELISDLLDTSRIVSGTLTMDFKEVDLKQVIKASVETLRVQASQKSIDLVSFVEVREEVSCIVRGDEARLLQILINVLHNALKFTPSGGSVSVQLRKVRAIANIVVKDTGKGISPEFLPHIFERFSQEVDSRKGGGLGLGLAICKHLVELHGGSISAQSKGPRCGTIIKVDLPTVTQKSGSNGHPEKSVARKDERKPDTRLKGIKVLAVDDNPDSRLLLKVLLERSSAEAVVVSSGQEALSAIRNVHPDVLICDLAMPEMDGYELLEKVRHLEPALGQMPVIAFTAAARDEDLAATREAGFQAHLPKPVEPDELVNTILELVREHAS